MRYIANVRMEFQEDDKLKNSLYGDDFNVMISLFQSFQP